MSQPNKRTAMICGASTNGKSASLRDLPDPAGVLYLNMEAGKDLPFKSKFKEVIVTDPLQAYTYMDAIEKPDNGKCHTVVFDGTNFMMDMFELLHVTNAADTQKAWGQYQEFFKRLMQTYVARSTKNVLFTGHTFNIYDKENMVMEKKIPVKGALAKAGIEAYFTTIVAAKQVPISMLEDFQNDLLTITPEEEAIGA